MFFNSYHLFTLLLPIPLDPRLHGDDGLNFVGVRLTLAHLVRPSLIAKAFGSYLSCLLAKLPPGRGIVLRGGRFAVSDSGK